MNARDYALHQIDSARLPGWSGKVIHKSAAPEDPRDRGLGDAIAIGVIKNLGLLKHLIKHYSGRKLPSIDSAVQKILAIALFQLRFMPRIRAAAIVDEAVEQTKRHKLGRASAFVNAVLRRAGREPEVPLPGPDNPEQFATVTLSHPAELWEKLLRLMSIDDALALCDKNNHEPPTILRLAHGVKPSSLKAAGENQITVTQHRKPGYAVVSGAKTEDFAHWARENHAQVQDPTAGEVIKQFAPFGGMRVLDRCCGVGTKTIQLAQLAGKNGRVVAMDPNQTRINMLWTSIKNLTLTNIDPVCDGMLANLEVSAPFDRILIDVPCSNSGVLPRRPEARYRQDKKSMKKLVDLQRDILKDTMPHLAVGGQLIYSTCSIWPEENGEQLKWMISEFPGLEMVDVQNTLPALGDDPLQHHDGGFFAVVKRTV